jgi:hypothetical protein
MSYKISHRGMEIFHSLSFKERPNAEWNKQFIGRLSVSFVMNSCDAIPSFKFEFASKVDQGRFSKHSS